MKHLLTVVLMLLSMAVYSQEVKLAVRQTQNLGIGANSRPNVVLGRSGNSNAIFEFIADSLYITSGTFAGNNLVQTIDNINAAAGSVQTLAIDGSNQLTILNGNTVSLAPYLDNTDSQDLTLSGTTLSLTGDGTSVNLSGIIPAAQNLGTTATQLTISNGTAVSLTAIAPIRTATHNGTALTPTSGAVAITEKQALTITGTNTLTLSASGTTSSSQSRIPARATYVFPLTGSTVTSFVLPAAVSSAITGGRVLQFVRNSLVQRVGTQVSGAEATLVTNTLTFNYSGLSSAAAIGDSYVFIEYYTN